MCNTFAVYFQIFATFGYKKVKNSDIFMVYISFLISHVPPAHSFFQKKSILINLTQNLVQLIF